MDPILLQIFPISLFQTLQPLLILQENAHILAQAHLILMIFPNLLLNAHAPVQILRITQSLHQLLKPTQHPKIALQHSKPTLQPLKLAQ